MAYCCCRAIPAPAPTGCGRAWPTSCSSTGQPLDAGRYFIIIPDALGRGGSSKPSDGLKGKFPHYRYHDMVDSTHRLVTDGLKVAPSAARHRQLARLHAQLLWAEMYPELMDGIVGLSCQPVEISGRNWIMRRAAAEAIRHDPDWNNGNYDKNPTHYIYSAAAGSFMPESAARIQEDGADPRRGGPALRRAGGADRQGRRQQLAVGDRSRSRTTAPRPIFRRSRPRCC